MHTLAEKVRLIVFDFDGVFTDNRVLVLQNGKEGVFCNRGDGIGLEVVKSLDVHLLVLSKEKNPVVGARCKKLGLPYIQGCDNKAKILRHEAGRLHIPLGNIAYMGNDINDLECLNIVGFPVCVADAHPSVLAVSVYVTHAMGGQGAVREFCDYIGAVKTGKTAQDKKA